MQNIQRRNLEEKLHENWHLLAVPGRLEAGCGAPFRLETSFFYGGGSISLYADRAELVRVEREAEFNRLDIWIPEALQSREDKILSLMDQLCDRAIQRAHEEDRLANQVKADRAIALLDALPDQVDAPVTRWAIARIGRLDEGYIDGPFDSIDRAKGRVGEHIAVELDGRSSKPLRGFTLENGDIRWHDADRCASLQPPAPEESDTPEPGF